MEGSTKAGPGLIRKVSGAPTENQMRAPASRGIVQLTVLPGAPRGMDTFCSVLAPVLDGLDG